MRSSGQRHAVSIWLTRCGRDAEEDTENDDDENGVARTLACVTGLRSPKSWRTGLEGRPLATAKVFEPSWSSEPKARAEAAETAIVGPSNGELSTDRGKSAASHINRKQCDKAQKNLRDVPRREILGK